MKLKNKEMNYFLLKKTILIPAISVSLLWACNIYKKASTSPLIIEYERTECSGTCPVYTIKIYENGVAFLDARKNLDYIGLYHGRITQNELLKLKSSFDACHFFELNDSYESLMLDLPTKYITYTFNGKNKKVKAYYNIPKNLKRLINELDLIVTSVNWEKHD